MQIRMYQKQDTTAIMELFQETIRTVNRKDYSAIQVAKWAAGADGQEESWHKRLTESTTYVVEEGLSLDLEI
ncbi:putative acetyltransferase [Oceanobacillus limi]|uniref:Putative acetyltransferase n=1 Tax=Oceanobacillus limi TaxID=930131 RepID=A0A1I0AFP3_9BACI|nr:hypothetical protein [Oceanobacillus limi]SES92506.1 putative acetyltransferase [Oceanobacillus limi]